MLPCTLRLRSQGYAWMPTLAPRAGDEGCGRTLCVLSDALVDGEGLGVLLLHDLWYILNVSLLILLTLEISHHHNHLVTSPPWPQTIHLLHYARVQYLLPPASSQTVLLSLVLASTTPKPSRL